jgi:hypothetical protein
MSCGWAFGVLLVEFELLELGLRSLVFPPDVRTYTGVQQVFRS